MDPLDRAQVLLLCDPCQTTALECHCELCQINLCKACVGEHLSDSSKRHNVVPYKHRKSATYNYPKCPNHNLYQTKNHCEFYCEQCDIPVCSTCTSSNKHIGHNLLDVLQKLSSKTKDMEKELKEFETRICPKYEEIASGIKNKKGNLETHYRKLTTAVTKQGEAWHKEINIIVNKQKSEIDEMKSKHLAVLDKHEDEIKQKTAEVNQCIHVLKKILDSNDVFLTSAYKFRSADFRCSPPDLSISLPSFSPYQINTEELNQIFGSLSALSITTEECCYTVKLLLDEPELITTINTGYKRLYSVSCLGDDEIWTRGNDLIMKLYNLQGKLLKSIQTLGNEPRDIAVTSSGDLVYTDAETRTVNIVKKKQIQEVIRLQGWKPYYVCSTSSGDFLVTMCSDDDKQTKVVRYSSSTDKQTIQFDSEGKPLYSSGYNIKYISENRNLDICVADNVAGAVVVVNQAGTLRFRYTGHRSTSKESFYPRGIATDSQSQILTADRNDCIHILNQNGQFLRYIDNCDLKCPWGLCVDSKDNLFVAENISCKVKRIRYMLPLHNDKK